MAARIRRDSTTTMKQMQQDDLAKQAVLRYQSDPNLINTARHPFPLIRPLADKVLQENRQPETIAEWLALIMFHGREPRVRLIRQQAENDLQAVYMQAQRWLELVDNSRY